MTLGFMSVLRIVRDTAHGKSLKTFVIPCKSAALSRYKAEGGGSITANHRYLRRSNHPCGYDKPRMSPVQHRVPSISTGLVARAGWLQSSRTKLYRD